MQRLEVSGAVRPLYGSLGVKGLMPSHLYQDGLLSLTIKPALLKPFPANVENMVSS